MLFISSPIIHNNLLNLLLLLTMLLIENVCYFIVLLCLVWFQLLMVIETRSAGNRTDLVNNPVIEDEIDEIDSTTNSTNLSLIVNNDVGKERNGKAISREKPDLVTCQTMEVETDKSFKKLLMIGEDFLIPRNESELQVYCSRGKSAMKIAKSYGKCLKPFPNQVLRIIIHGGKKTLKEYCGATKGRTEILKHLECLTPETSKIFYTTLEHGFRRLDYIADHVKDDDLLSTICCTFHLIYDQALNLIRNHCAKSPDSTVKFIRTIIDNIAKDVLDLGCSKWSSLDTCDVKLSNIMSTLRSIQPPTGIGLDKRFLIGPIVSIASRLVA